MFGYEIDWAKRATKQLLKIDAAHRARILLAIAGLRDLPAASHVLPLVGHDYGYRLRVGQYRVLFDVDEHQHVITIQQIGKRDDNTY